MSLLETYNCKDHGPCSVFVERDDDTGLFHYLKKVGRGIKEEKAQKLSSDNKEDSIEYHPDYHGPDSSVWHKYENVYTYAYPNTIKCPVCKKKTDERASIYYFSVGNGRNSFAAMNERRRYAVDGMDKKQAEVFYKESIQASKERMTSGDQHYKKMVPDYEVLQKEGRAKRLTDQQTSQKIENLKRANQLITKDGTIGKGVRKK